MKWLDLSALAAALRPDAATSVRYITARVPPVPDPGSAQRQRLYLKAIEMLPKVTVHLGHFSLNPSRMALVDPPAQGARTVEVWKTEERGSDVNIATFLLLDGQDGLYDEAIVISRDSDLVELIRQANRRCAPVTVLNPRNVHSDLAAAAASYGPLDPALLPRCQQPETIHLPTGRTVRRPAAYRRRRLRRDLRGHRPARPLGRGLGLAVDLESTG